MQNKRLCKLHYIDIYMSIDATGKMWAITSAALYFYTANNYWHCTANCGVTFLTIIWQYSELLMAAV